LEDGCGAFGFNGRMTRIALAMVMTLLGGCAGDKFSPRLVSPVPVPRADPFAPDRFGDLAWRRFARQFAANRDLPPERLRHVIVLIMLPSYGTVEQIRHGNMGHVAIDVDGRLYDMGALNGYAYVFRANPAVRFWDFPDADSAVAAVRNHPDCDGHLDRIVRFDVTVTDEQAARLRDWWDQMERRMLADPTNKL
jgi:hypothetical protein